MSDLVFVALAGFVASLVDGALGMGFGPTSSTILLSAGIAPAAAATTVNLAKVATGLVAGASHWRFGNIDRPLVIRLALPGAFGALIGTTVLVFVDGDDLRPLLATVLLLVGLRILLRFSRPLPLRPDTDAGVTEGELPPFDRRGVEIAATAGGITNGMVGAWGPVVTPFLLHRGLPPRFAVGSVNTAEVAVALVASVSLISSLGSEGLEVGIVIAMLLGGMLAAPIAAYVVKYVPARGLGLAVAGLLLLTQTRELATFFELGAMRWLIYGAVVAALAIATVRPRIARKKSLSRKPSLS
jgi:uncharacterized protein